MTSFNDLNRAYEYQKERGREELEDERLEADLREEAIAMVVWDNEDEYEEAETKRKEVL